MLVIGTAVLVGGGSGGSVPSAGNAATGATITMMTPVVTLGDSGGRGTDAARTAPGTYPDPSSWTSLGGVGGGAESVFEVSPGVLCRTTPTSVYLTAPVPVSDQVPTVVGLGRGTVGVVGPVGTTVTADPGDGTAGAVPGLTFDGRTFVLAIPPAVDESRVTLTIAAPQPGVRSVPLSSAVPPLTVLDRPVPPQERSSADGMVLNRCLTAPDPSPPLSPISSTIPDPDAFTALPRLALPDGTVAVPTSAPGTSALCVSYGAAVALAAVSAVRPVAGGLLVNTDTVLADVLGGAHVAVLSVDPSAASVDVTPGNTTPVTCGLHDGVAYCLYRAGAGTTVFTARAADGAVVGEASP